MLALYMLCLCANTQVVRLRAMFRNHSPRSGGSNPSHVPLGEENAAQRYLAASQFKTEARGGFSSNPRVPAWDNRPYKPAPCARAPAPYSANRCAILAPA